MRAYKEKENRNYQLQNKLNNWMEHSIKMRLAKLFFFCNWMHCLKIGFTEEVNNLDFQLFIL